MSKLFIEDLDIKGKKVLIRVDFNVPLNEKLEITDDTRIQAALPSIKYILEQGGAAVLMSHLGRPKGEANPKFSLKPVQKRVSELLGIQVEMTSDCVGEEAEKMASELKPGEVMLLENLRFHNAETGKDTPEANEEFAKNLAKLGDVYVSDAFGTAHRAHASMVGVTKFLKPCAAGYLLQKEIDYLGNAVENPKKPFVAILGGAKVSDKIPVIENLLEKADAIIIGGAMAYTFLEAKGIAVGKSLVEKDLLETSASFLKIAKEKNVAMLLPIDHICAPEFGAIDQASVVETEEVAE